MAPRQAPGESLISDQHEKRFSCATSVISADAKAATVSQELPSTYANALEHLLQDNVAPLATLPDEEVVTIAREILQKVYDKEWLEAGKWADEEAKLYKLGGNAADVSIASAKFVKCTILIDYLRTFIEAIEYKNGNENGENMPELLTKKRTEGNDVVYGPISVSSILPGNTFEVWTTPATNKDESEHVDGELNKKATVAVVLGAGNQSMLTIVDILDNALRHRRPVFVKHHPLRPWLADPYGIMLEPLAKRGYFSQCVDVSVEVTKKLLSHPAVNHVHITGSLNTANAVKDTLQKANPTLSSSKIKSMVTSELGCATPQIIDDGDFTELELTHVVRMIACGKKANCGSNCLSPQVVLLSKTWKQKDLFREKLMAELKRQPTTPCYYPGSVDKNKSLVDHCKQFGSKCTTITASSVSEETVVSEDDHVKVVECGTPGEEGFNPHPLVVEAFGPTLAIVELASEDDKKDSYLANVVVPFLNNKENIFGSLSCSIFTTKSKGTVECEALRKVLATLNYGTVAVNQMNLFGYNTAAKGGMWGGHSLETLGQSGQGNVGDLFGIIGDSAAKVVVCGPPLETKPLLDNASPPPPAVMDIILQIVCSDSTLIGMGNAFALMLSKMFYGTVSYVPFVGRFVGKK